MASEWQPADHVVAFHHQSQYHIFGDDHHLHHLHLLHNRHHEHPSSYRHDNHGFMQHNDRYTSSITIPS
ncbi:hypothetical protein ONZ45_g14052 [Pleurotus djamor]|nr:hypothetical protein ONZ45_g14052 [Pleurotus djamor]